MNDSPSTYLQHYEEKLRQAMDHPQPQHLEIDDDTEIYEMAYSTWNVSFAAIEKQCSWIKPLLQFWGCLDNEGFSYDLICNYQVLGGPHEDLCKVITAGSKGFKDTMRLLHKFSMVEFVSTNHYAMHKLPHTWCRLGLRDASAKYSVTIWSALGCVGLAVPDRKDIKFWEKGQHLLPHAFQCWELKRKPPLASLSQESLVNQAGAMKNIAMLFRTQERLDQAKDALNSTETFLDALPHDFPKKQQIQSSLGSEWGKWEKDRGNLKAAVRHFETAYSGYKMLHGRDHQAFLSAASNLGSAYQKLGLDKIAEEKFQEVLDGCGVRTEKTIQETKIATQERYAKLLFERNGHGDQEAAIDYYENIYEIFLERFNHDNVKTARAACNLAMNYLEINQMKYGTDSQRLYEKYIPVIEKHKPQSELLYSVKNGYGRLCTMFREFEKAHQLLEEAISGYREIRSEKYRPIYGVRSNMADLLWAQGHYEEAEHAYRLLEPHFPSGWLKEKLGQSKEHMSLTSTLSFNIRKWIGTGSVV